MAAPSAHSNSPLAWSTARCGNECDREIRRNSSRCFSVTCSGSAASFDGTPPFQLRPLFRRRTTSNQVEKVARQIGSSPTHRVPTIFLGRHNFTSSYDGSHPHADHRQWGRSPAQVRAATSSRFKRRTIHDPSPCRNDPSMRATTAGISSAGTAGENRKPCTRSTPSSTRSSNSSLVSTPSASTSIPS